jgi:hypothetical protein
MSSCTVLDPLGAQAVCRLGHHLGCSGKMFWVSLLATFSNFNCFLLCFTILILSYTHEHFRLAEGVSAEIANIVFGKVARKVIMNTIKHTHLVLLAGAEAFVVFNSKLLSYNNICCTTRRC